MSVTYGKLANRILEDLESKQHPLRCLNPDQVASILRAGNEAIMDALSEGEDVELDGFGRFWPDIKPPRALHSNLTQSEYQLGHKVLVRFNAFTRFNRRVHKLLRWVRPQEENHDSARK